MGLLNPLDPPVLTSKSAAAKYVAGGNRIPVCDRVFPPYFNPGSLSDGTKQGFAWRSKHPVINSGHSLEISYSNVQNITALGESDGPNPITVYAAVEPPGFTAPIPITPPNGYTLLPGQTVTFNVGLRVTAGDTLWVRTQVSVATLGMKWSFGNPIVYAGEGILDTSASPNTDISMSSIAANYTYTAGYSWGPAAITAITNVPKPCVMTIGTSVEYGLGGTVSDNSWVNRALVPAGIPHQNLAVGGSSGSQFVVPQNHYRRMQLTKGIQHTHGIWAHWTNDRGYIFSDIQIMTIKGWRFMAMAGMKVWAVTGIPSTDAGNAVANSTAIRDPFNAWVRDGAPLNPTTFAAVATGTAGSSTVVRFGQSGHPAVGFFDTAAAAEATPITGLWKAGYTTDGIHPTDAGHAAMAAAINAAVFTV